MSAVVTPTLDAAELKHRIVQFARSASTEISTHDEPHLAELARELPQGTTVYVAHVPKASLADVVRVAIKVQALGLTASPHIVARRLESLAALRSALSGLAAGGVHQVLLVAGDLDKPVGEFPSTLEIVDSGALEQTGMQRVGVAGHPEGHRAVSDEALWGALAHKQAYAQRSGMKVHIATQFSFDPQAICDWDRKLTEHGIQLPVHVGIAGPTPLTKLVKFAMQCGVGASLRAVMKNMATMSKMARLATSPDEMLVGLLRGTSGNNATHLRQPHFFAFGGTIATAQWLRRVAEGRFELPADGGKFVMD